MTGEALVCRLKNLSPIEGADNIVQSDMFGETVIVPKSYKEGELGVLFDIETQLSEEYCKHNNLYRDKTKNIDPEKTGYFEDNRRVRPIKLKGVKCSGMWMPITSLEFIKGEKDFSEGSQINVVGGVRICEKYIPTTTKKSISQKRNMVKKEIVPFFKEHIDTDQLMRNMNSLKEGNYVVITEKLHGTSGRAGNLQIKKYKPRNIKNFLICSMLGLNPFKKESYGKQEYGFVVGSRRVIKSVEGTENKRQTSYYKEDIWTKASEHFFKDKLYKGETVYFEIVGYTLDNTPLMGSYSNTKLKNFLTKSEYKEFIAKYGENTVFSYGCDGEDKSFDVYVYRITMTNEEGYNIDYSWEQVKNRCEQLGVKYTPELHKIIIPNNDYEEEFSKLIETYSHHESTNFPNHIKEGIVVRIENGKPTPEFLKHKNYVYKVLEGIMKDHNPADIEESN